MWRLNHQACSRSHTPPSQNAPTPTPRTPVQLTVAVGVFVLRQVANLSFDGGVSSTDTQPAVRAVSRRGEAGETESQQHRSQLGPITKKTQTTGSAARPGKQKKGSERDGERGQSVAEGHPVPGSASELGRIWPKPRERPGARLAGRAGTLGGSAAGLEWLTHMARRSVPALCLNPYAAGGKVPPPPSTLP